MTVTEALNTLSLMEKKINKAINTPIFVAGAKTSSDKVGHAKKETFAENAKASLQSAMDLITYRDKVKAAVVLSNATTTLVVGKKTMTVAEAIETKNSIINKKILVAELTRQYESAKKDVESNNTKVETQVNKLREQYLGNAKEGKLDAEGFEAMADSYHKQNDFAMVDPCNLATIIQKLTEEIEDFELNVNTALVLKNATTFIEV